MRKNERCRKIQLVLISGHPSLNRLLFRLTLLLFSISSAFPQSVIRSIAGGGPNNTPALRTGMRFSGMSFDAAGNIYGTSTLQPVLKITPDGRVYVVAGSAINYFIPVTLGDGGPAINAAMVPEKVVSDPAGNLYIADAADNRIRKVTAATGIISTIAGNGIPSYGGDGGLAVNASFDLPADILLDGQGNLYVADYENGRIRKISLSTGVVTTVAGSGSSSLSGDGGLAILAGIGLPSDHCLESRGHATLYHCL